MGTRPRPTRTHVLFDLDGTLTDSAEGILGSLRHALRRLGLPEIEEARLRGFIGPPLAATFRELGDFGDAQIQAAIAYYREYFASVGWRENRVYPGIPELLSDLAASGVTLSVATSKPTVYAQRILEHFDLASFFAHVVGSELDGRRSAKSEVVLEVLERQSHPLSACVLVGDRAHDVLGARAAGIDCIAVGYGYGALDELRASKPWNLALTVEDVARVLLV
jgi:phosphoglycolate phosphatase